MRPRAGSALSVRFKGGRPPAASTWRRISEGVGLGGRPAGPAPRRLRTCRGRWTVKVARTSAAHERSKTVQDVDVGGVTDLSIDVPLATV